MINRFNISDFISRHITAREKSMFESDLRRNASRMTEEIRGKSILVVGGAGTIGASFIKTVLRYHPESLYVIDTNENGLTELTRDLRSSNDLTVPGVYRSYPLDFGDKIFEKIIRKEGPFDIVANFAAHKHVRSDKDPYSIEAMFNNNVFKARTLLEHLVPNPPEHFFCVSTDKATNPVNLMGASKLMMEYLILAYSEEIPISTARFANVAFSNGSLLFGFLERIMKRQPLSSPSDVRRYFISPEESGQLCALACMLGNSGEIFFPKLELNQMMTFSSIAESFLREIGMEPYICTSEKEAREMAMKLAPNSTEYPVFFFSSDTSGEKQFEEFYSSSEEIELGRFDSLGVIKKGPVVDLSTMNEMMEQLRESFASDNVNKSDILELVESLIPEFNYADKGKNLDSRM